MLQFDHNGQRYHLRHNNDDDSRSVTRDGIELLRICSSLNITKDGTRLGYMQSGKTARQDDVWVLVRGEQVTSLDIACRDHCWRQLMKAEVEAAKLLLG
jgi:hypothetical protein